MIKNCPIIAFGLLFAVLMTGSSYAQTATPAPKSGSSTVNASVSNPTSTPTPTNSPTPTPTPSASPSPTPTLPPGVTPTNTPVPTKSPTPTPTVTETPSKQVYIDISGLASPNASIVMTTEGTFLRSTVANKEGEFSITQVKISEAKPTFCLEAIDFKRVGTSYTCFNTPNQSQGFKKDDIFLPPTMGLSARRISTKGSAFFFGYTMPKSSVTSHIAADNEIVSSATDQGYYRVEVKNLPVGTYHLFATAVYESKDSSKPNKNLELQSVTQGQAVGDELTSIWNRIFSSLRGFIERFGWIVIPILILIIILIAKLTRDRLKAMETKESKLSFGNSKKDNQIKLHHDWFL